MNRDFFLCWQSFISLFFLFWGIFSFIEVVRRRHSTGLWVGLTPRLLGSSHVVNGCLLTQWVKLAPQFFFLVFLTSVLLTVLTLHAKRLSVLSLRLCSSSEWLGWLVCCFLLLRTTYLKSVILQITNMYLVQEKIVIIRLSFHSCKGQIWLCSLCIHRI